MGSLEVNRVNFTVSAKAVARMDLEATCTLGLHRDFGCRSRYCRPFQLSVSRFLIVGKSAMDSIVFVVIAAANIQANAGRFAPQAERAKQIGNDTAAERIDRFESHIGTAFGMLMT